MSRPALVLAIVAVVLAIVGDVLIYNDYAGEAVVFLGGAVVAAAVAVGVNHRSMLTLRRAK